MSVTLSGIPIKSTTVGTDEVQHVIVETEAYEPTAEDNYMLINGIRIRSTNVGGFHVQHVRVEPGMEQVRYEGGYIYAPGMPPFRFALEVGQDGSVRVAAYVLVNDEDKYVSFSDYGS